VNISSPNTPGLRDLQQEEWLKKLFARLAPLKAKLNKEIKATVKNTFIDLGFRLLKQI
jgi:dihydroorotate dehydrogenase